MSSAALLAGHCLAMEKLLLRRPRAACRRGGRRRAGAAPARRAASRDSSCGCMHASAELRCLIEVHGPRRRATRRDVSGSPKSGNSVSVSRKKLNSTIRPPESSSTCSAHGLVAIARLARLVLAERGRAVRRHGRDHARALAADPGPEPPGEDVVAAGEPEVERRHRLRRVLVDQRGERVDVVRLEGRDVARRAARGRARRARRRPGRRARPARASPARAAARCSPRRRSSRAARRPRSPASAAPRRGSARRAGAAAGAAAPRRRRAGSSRARRRRLGGVAATSESGIGCEPRHLRAC